MNRRHTNTHIHTRRTLVSLLALSVLLMAACNTGTPTAPTQQNTPADTPPVPTATDSSPPTIAPTATMPAVRSARQPLCPLAPPTRLIVFERAQVTEDNDETLNLRTGPGTSYRRLAQLEPGAIFFVLDGPVCDDVEGFAWYRISYNGREGWIAEGDPDEYYAEPYLTG